MNVPYHCTMETAFETYLTQDLTKILSELEPDRKPNWGKLTPQHMIEHVIGSWRISNGRAQAPLLIPEEDIPKRMAFLHGPEPFAQDVRTPVMPENPGPLRKPDLASANAQLVDDVLAFFPFFEANPDARPVHPLFGPLNREEWLRFQWKHMGHHFRQFNLPFPEKS